MAEQIRRVAVWSGRLRLAHWLAGGATLALIATGWLLDAAPSLVDGALDFHYLAASALLVGLVLRAWLGFFGQGAERFEHLLLADSEVQAVRQSLVFYLTLGKAPLPNWFAHNPLWKPLYLLWLSTLVLAAVTGWLLPDMPVIGRIYLPTIHVWLANATAMLVLLHVYSVVLQDLRGQAADSSAMINGHRYFTIDREGLVKPDLPEVSIRLDDIGKR